MKSWYEVYLDEIKQKKDAKNYINDKIKHKKVFIKMIEKYSKKSGKKILEAGCGTGIISSYMAAKGYNVVGIDVDNDILNLAKKLSKEYFKDQSKIEFINKDIFKLDYPSNNFDVCFSNGVLEHFSDKEIVETITQQLRISNIVVIGIPTQFFDKSEALYGNERFLPIDYWRYLITLSGGRILEEHSFHYMTILEKIMAFKKIGRPRPFRLFVIEKL